MGMGMGMFPGPMGMPGPGMGPFMPGLRPGFGGPMGPVSRIEIALIHRMSILPCVVLVSFLLACPVLLETTVCLAMLVTSQELAILLARVCLTPAWVYQEHPHQRRRHRQRRRQRQLHSW